MTLTKASSLLMSQSFPYILRLKSGLLDLYLPKPRIDRSYSALIRPTSSIGLTLQRGPLSTDFGKTVTASTYIDYRTTR
jgi:hypothetical protein